MKEYLREERDRKSKEDLNVYKARADKTDGMNKYNGLDQVQPWNALPLEEKGPKKISKKELMEESREEAAEDHMAQLKDRLDTNSFQG